jgi:hypothetical protein
MLQLCKNFTDLKKNMSERFPTTSPDNNDNENNLVGQEQTRGDLLMEVIRDRAAALIATYHDLANLQMPDEQKSA